VRTLESETMMETDENPNIDSVLASLDDSLYKENVEQLVNEANIVIEVYQDLENALQHRQGDDVIQYKLSNLLLHSLVLEYKMTLVKDKLAIVLPILRERDSPIAQQLK